MHTPLDCIVLHEVVSTPIVNTYLRYTTSSMYLYNIYFYIINFLGGFCLPLHSSINLYPYLDQCSPGYISSTGLVPCELCPNSQYQLNYGATNCTPCKTCIQYNYHCSQICMNTQQLYFNN